MPAAKNKGGAQAPVVRSFPADQYVQNRESDTPNAVVNIHVSGKIHDYMRSWAGVDMITWTGSGFCIDGANFGQEGKRYIMTNTHVAESAHLTEVRLALSGDTYNAKSVFIGQDVDIGLLEIIDTLVPDAQNIGKEKVVKKAEDFWKEAKLLEFGESLSIQDEVWAYGFPTGGGELATTKGGTSRIEMGLNVVSDIETLIAQWEGAIHPGNSGGPVVNAGGKVLGVVHQGRDVQGGGEFIPLPILKHVLEDWKTHGIEGYKGFPGLAMSWDFTKNSYLKEYLGMKEKHRGIRVCNVPKLSAAHGILQTDDVILKIGGTRIESDGTYRVKSGIQDLRIGFMHLLNLQQIGDTIDLEILRCDKPGSGEKAKRYRVPLTLKHRVGALDVVPLEQSGQPPRFFRFAGLAFVPFTGHFYAGGLEAERPEFMIHHERTQKTAGEEIVLLQKMILNRYTQGYDTSDAVNRLVKSVNGREIHSMQDLVSAFEEQTKGKSHEIRLGGENSEDLLVLPWLSPEERTELLEEYGIPFDRSADLRTETVPGFGARVSLAEKEKTAKRTRHPKKTTGLQAQLGAMDASLESYRSDSSDSAYDPSKDLAANQGEKMEMDLGSDSEGVASEDLPNSADEKENEMDRSFIDHSLPEVKLDGSVMEQDGVLEAIGSQLGGGGAAFTTAYASALRSERAVTRGSSKRSRSEAEPVERKSQKSR